MIFRAFHGTSSDRAVRILREGFRLDAGHLHDPGDFGRAVYLTTAYARARALGPAVLTVELDLHNPVDLSDEEAYALVIDKLGFDTIHGRSHAGGRMEAARLAREHFLGVGHDALLSRRNAPGGGEVEVAVYDLHSIRSVTARRAAV